MGQQFTWGDLTITVRELNRADVFRAATAFDALINDFVGDESSTPIGATSEINWILTAHSPAVVRYKGVRLEDGIHTIGEGDDTFTLTLPLTRYCFELDLPGSLALQWGTAAWEANPYLANEFFLALKRITENISGQKSDAA